MPLVTQTLASQINRRVEAYAYNNRAYYLPAADPSVTDAYGQPTASTSLIPFNCSFSDKPNTEKWTGIVDIEELQAEVRMITPTPTKGGRVKIVERYGAAVPEKTYEIIGIQERGAFGFVCALKEVSV